MVTGRQTIPAETVTELEISGNRQLYIRPVSNDIDLVNSVDTDATNGYTLLADTENIVRMYDKIYIYAASETTIKYMTL